VHNNNLSIVKTLLPQCYKEQKIYEQLEKHSENEEALTSATTHLIFRA